MFDLVVVGRCGQSALLQHLRPRSHGARTTIDLTRLTFCEPLGLVAVAAFAEDAARTGTVVVTAPHEASVARYLSRMRLGRVLSDLGVGHDLPVVREHPLDDVLLELTRFESSRSADELAGIVHRAVEDVDPVAAGALHDGIVELGDNVPRHARTPCGFVAAQKLDHGRDLLFAVGDAGVGVLATLRASGATSSAQALELAVTAGVTEAPAESGGTGLSGILSHLCALDGGLTLVSGDASLTITGAGRVASSGDRALPGTAVQGVVTRRAPE